MIVVSRCLELEIEMIPLIGSFFFLGITLGKLLGERTTSNIYITELKRVWKQKSDLWKKIRELF